MSNVYSELQKLSTDEIFGLFSDQYIFEYGEKKATEINHQVGHSKAVEKYLNNLIISNQLPDDKIVVETIHSSSFFMFAKAETFCLGALVITMFWKEAMEQYKLSYDQQALSRLMTEIILRCSRMKLNKADNFFHRFAESVKELSRKDTRIEKEPELCDHAKKLYKATIIATYDIIHTHINGAKYICAEARFMDGPLMNKVYDVYRPLNDGRDGISVGKEVLVYFTKYNDSNGVLRPFFEIQPSTEEILKALGI